MPPVQSHLRVTVTRPMTREMRPARFPARWTPPPGSASSPPTTRCAGCSRSRPGISTGHQFLFGGCGLGAAIAALEGSSGGPSCGPPPSTCRTPTRRDHGHRRHHRRAGQAGHPGPCRGPRRRPGDPHRERGPRPARHRGRAASGPRCRTSRRPTSARSACRGSRAPSRSWTASTSASPSPATR